MKTPDLAKFMIRDTITFVSNDIENFRHHRNHLVDIASEMGMNVFLLAGGNGAAPDNCDFKRVNIDRFKFHWKDIHFFILIFNNILRRRPSILHLVNLKPYLYGSIAARVAKALGWRGKLVVSVPGLGRIYNFEELTLAKKVRLRGIEFALKACLRDATVCFETNSDRDFWVKRGLVTLEKTEVTNGTGIDLMQFDPPSERVSNKRLRVLYAGRLLKAKGLDVFLRAAEINQVDAIEMIVAGQIEADPDAVPENILRGHPGVSYVGKVDDMPSLLGTTNVVVLPSRYNEGVPRILIEAAACRCVPVATDFAGSRAVIKDGITGFFIHQASKENQANEILSIIRKLLENPGMIDTIGSYARDHISNSGFSSDAVKSAFRRIYSK